MYDSIMPTVLKGASSNEIEIPVEWTWNNYCYVGWEEDAPETVVNPYKSGHPQLILSMMKDAPGSEQKAYDFLDAWLSDASAEYIVTEWGYGHTNKEVMATVGKENGWEPFPNLRGFFIYTSRQTIRPQTGTNE